MNWDNLCQICREKSAPYKCPKCQLRYCSLTCYRDQFHEQCTKQFDEKEFFDSMPIIDDENNEQQTTTTTNEFVRTRIEEIIKRKLDEKEFHNEEDDEHMEDFFEQILPSKDSDMYREEPIDDEGEDDGEERLMSDEEQLPDLPDDIDNDSEENINQLWNYLTNEEKQEFKTMLSDGRISHLLNDYKPWKPWWLFKIETQTLITDLDNPSTSSSTLPDSIPSIVLNIVPLPSLTSILPHIHVRFDLFEVLFAYVLINIRYRGDFSSYILESGNEFLHISSRHLTQRPELTSEEQDSISVLQTRISLLREYLQEKTISLRLSEDFFVNLLVDISMIIHGPYSQQTPSNIYVLAALSDIKRFVIKMQEYKPPIEELPKEKTSNVTNVFHQNRPMNQKILVNHSNNSKLCIRSSPIVSKSSFNPSKPKKIRPFNHKQLQSISRKIDYLLSWTITHVDRLRILEYELRQIEEDLRQQLNQYQRDKIRIEKNLDRLRLKQKNLVEEL